MTEFSAQGQTVMGLQGGLSFELVDKLLGGVTFQAQCPSPAVGFMRKRI
jgi:hypothetical protein